MHHNLVSEGISDAAAQGGCNRVAHGLIRVACVHEHLIDQAPVARAKAGNIPGTPGRSPCKCDPGQIACNEYHG